MLLSFLHRFRMKYISLFLLFIFSVAVYSQDKPPGIKDTVLLNEVTVSAPNKTERLRLNPIKSEVIDVTQSLDKATNIQNLLNNSPGVRLRNTGALGATTDVIINGFSGRSVKLMRDGIPLDYLGSGFGISKIPVNSLERIEVYKGVLPAEIGIDALGGAINLVSRQFYRSEWQVSFERGSFNTNIATINGLHRLNNRLSVGVYAFGNYSDNDYTARGLPYLDESTGQNTYIDARLFHNAFKQYFAEAFLNIDNVRWADLLQFRLTSLALHQQIQNDFTTRDRAFGAVYRTEKAPLIPSVTYKKAFAGGKINTTQFAVYSRINTLFVDTLKNTWYDWKGAAHPTVSGSEIGSAYTSHPSKNGVESDFSNFIYRGWVSYRPVSSHAFTFNIVENHLVNTRDDEADPLQKKSILYNRLIVGVGHEGRFFRDRLSTIAQVKSLSYHTDGETTDYVTLEKRKRSVTKQGWSFSLSAKYDIAPRLLVRASFENTFRLPDQEEIFGDNTFVVPNADLSPERSVNYNIGLKFYKNNTYNFEVNSYFRNTRDLIKLKELNQYQGMFLNLEKVKGYGIEFDGYYTFFDRLKVMGNVTYNEFRYNGSIDEINDVHYQDARISNMPFYYGNLGAEYVWKELFGKENKLKAYWNYSYVHQYYLDFIERQFEPDGFLGLFGKTQIYTDRVIPVQQHHTVGATFDMGVSGNDRVTLGLEVRNLFNADIYNNFKIQSPGRSFWAKVVYLIK
ncbi:MAG TPA: hypothetical protein DDW85_08540 [Porphyromonadaceae bacterium]|nr:hypothetical protein [Porphyromonadaceae bacterium]